MNRRDGPETPSPAVRPSPIGALRAVPAPDGMSAWRLVESPSSSPFDPVEVWILLEKGEQIDAVDFPTVSGVLADLEQVLADGLGLIHVTALSDPVRFGLSPTDCDRYRDRPATDLPLDLPQLIFYVGVEWMLRFAGVDWPACRAEGVAVWFDDRHPVRIEDLAA